MDRLADLRHRPSPTFGRIFTAPGNCGGDWVFGEQILGDRSRTSPKLVMASEALTGLRFSCALLIALVWLDGGQNGFVYRAVPQFDPPRAEWNVRQPPSDDSSWFA
jgi:hypothetical protein